MRFSEFLLQWLPSAPARVLEIGCGPNGGVTPALAAAGYDVLAVDPKAPDGPAYRRTTFEELDEEAFDAIVAERVFHHVHPLGDALDKVARMSPLFALDEFAWDRIDDATQEWYEAQHRALVASGRDPVGPPDLEEWRAEWDDLHPSTVVLEEVGRRFETRHYEDLPYLFRWLDGPASAPLEQALLAAGAVQPIGFRWAGVSRSAAARPAG